jgi:hypothetical protein
MLVMTYVCPTWKYAVGAHLMKLHNLHKSFLQNWRTWHSYLSTKYDFQNSLCVQNTGRSNLNHQKQTVCGTGEGDAMHWKYKRLKLGSGQAYDHSAD